MSLLPRPVLIWMRWLNIVFLIGLMFVHSHVEARWALAAYAVCFPVGFLIYYFVRDIDITGLPHIIFWTPLLVYLPYAALQDPTFSLVSFYGVWISLLLATIAVSVVLDIKAAFAVFGRVRTGSR